MTTTILKMIALALLSSQAQAGTYYLEPNGRPVNIGYHTVVCGRPVEPEPEIKFQCACFAPDRKGTNLGMVWGIYATSRRDAEEIAMYQCGRQYHRPIGSVMCSEQKF